MKYFFKKKDGFSVIGVIIVVAITGGLLVLVIPSLVWSRAPENKTTIFKTSTITGVFTQVPARLGYNSTMVKFQLTDSAVKGISGRTVKFRLSNTKDSMFTKKDQAVTNGSGVASIGIQAKKKHEGEGIISATLFIETTGGLIQITEDSMKFEISGNYALSTY